MKKSDFLAKVNSIFKASDDYYGEIIIDAKIQIYPEGNCLWCQLDEGTTEAALDQDGRVNFCRSGWFDVSDEMKNWVELAKNSSERFTIPFENEN